MKFFTNIDFTNVDFDIKKFVIKHRYFLIFLVINIIAHRKILLFGTQLAYGDVTPFPEYANQALGKFVFSWEEIGFGLSRQSGGIFSLVLWAFTFILRSPLLAQKLYILILPTIAFVTFGHFLRKTAKINNGFSIFLTSFFFALCPVALGEFMGGSIYSTMLIFAMFPYLYENTFKLLDDPSRKRIIIHGLLIGIYASLYIHIILIYFLSLLAPFFYDLFTKKIKAIKRWFNFVYAGLIAILLNPIYFLSGFNILKNSSREETRSFVDYIPQFLQEMTITYESGKFFSALRLASFGAFDYHENHLWTVPFFIIIAFALFFAVLKLTKRDGNKSVTSKKFAIIGLVNYVGITLFIFFTYKEWAYPIFRGLPLLFMFRNPSKLIYLSTFFFCILYAFALESFLKRKFKKSIVFVVLTLIVVIQSIYIWPIFIGDRGLESRRKRNFTIPNEFFEANQYIKSNRQNEFYRSTWLPIGHESTFNKLYWLDKNKLDAQIGMQEFAGSAYEHTVLTTTYGAVTLRDQVAFINSLRLVQVDYLVLLKDEYYYKLNNFNLSDIQNALTTTPIVESNDFYDIYYIDTNTPLIYSPKTITTTNIEGGGDYYVLSKLSTTNLNTLLPVTSINKHGIRPDDFYLFLYHSGEPVLVTNTQWNENWEWKTPSIYPNILNRPDQNTETGAYLIKSAESLAEISEYLTSSKTISNRDKQVLLNSYSDILNIYNTFLANLPGQKIDHNLKTYLVRIYLYVDRSYENLNKANLVTETIATQYTQFSSAINSLKRKVCEYDFCHNVNILAPSEYQVELYDLRPNDLNKKLHINSNQYPLTNFTSSDKWATIGNVHFQEGPYTFGINLDQEEKSIFIDHEKDSGSTVYIDNDETRKYTNTFLYSFDEDVHVKISYEPKEEYSSKRDYLVWKGDLARTNNSNICYKIEDGKCFRIYLANLQPTNEYKNIKIEFDKDVTFEETSANMVKDFSIKEFRTVTALLYDEQNIKPRQIPNISFEKINPSKYKVSVENVKEDFLFVFNQSFNSNWVLQTKDQERVAEDRHFKVNYFANAWWIKMADLKGGTSIDLEIVYYPQRYLYLSLVVTLITLSASLYIIFKDSPKKDPSDKM